MGGSRASARAPGPRTEAGVGATESTSRRSGLSSSLGNVHGDALAHLTETVSVYGYPLLLLTAIAENIFVVGFFVPGDLVVVLGGALVAGPHLRLGWSLAAVALGSMIGCV